MKTANRYLSGLIALLVVGLVLFLILDLAGPAFSAPRLSALIAPAPQAGDPIPLAPISGLKSLNATVNLDVNGKINGKRTKGDLTALVTSNDQNKSKVTVSGGLLGDITAQVGGSVVGLFTPKKVDLYKTPEGAFVVVNALVPICIKPDASKATEALEDVSPASLFTMLTGSDVARGELVGQETRKGVKVDHWVIDGDAFLDAAQNSSDSKLQTFGEALWSAEDIHLYLDAKTGLPIALDGSFTGAFEPLKFEGDFDVQLELTGVNTNTPVNLPAACNNPISK
jgi:hypothetical protein